MARKTVVVILAAGEGKRMQSPVPKVLVDLLGRPLLGHVVDAARALRPSAIIIVGGKHLPAMRATFGSEPLVSFARQAKPLGTGHAVKQALGKLPLRGADIAILNGDCPLIRGESLVQALATHRKSGVDLSALTAEVANPAGLGRIIRSVRGEFLRIVEEKDALPEERAISEINAGQYLVRVEALRRLLPSVGKKNSQGEYYLTDLVGLCHGRALAQRLGDPDEARGVNRPTELIEARRLLKARLVAEHTAAGVLFSDPDSTYLEVGVKIGVGTLIHPFVVLRRGVTIAAHCAVGPFVQLRDGASLGDGARVGNFVEMKASKLGPGSRALHLSYLGDAELGRDVNVGAGTITANFDGKRKWPTWVGDEASLGSSTVLVAPVRIGRAARTGAGSVVLAGHDVLPGSTVVGVPARPLRGDSAAKPTRKRGGTKSR